MINTVVQGTGEYQDLADIGITVNASGDATGGTMLDFNRNTFETAFATDPNAVQDLFSAATIGLGNVINNAMTALTDPVDGSITLEDNTLNTEITQYQDNINSLNAILADQKEYLQNEFNNMEETLATLQSQGTLLSALSSIKTSTTSSGVSAEGSASSSDSSSDSSSS
jgi:flagellar capping protein FliD